MTKLRRESIGREADFDPLDWRVLHPMELMQRIEEAGIVGMGGAGFPTARKMSIARQQRARHLIANGIESDPGVTADQYLLENHLDDVAEGIAIACRILELHDATLAVNVASLPDEITSIAGTRIVTVRTEDPFRTGEERELIKDVFGVSLISAEYPAEHGILVLNVSTLFAICEAVRDGRKPYDRVATIRSANRWVPIGTPIAELVDDTKRVRVGGPANGFTATAQTSLDATTNAISIDTSDKARNCIGCGHCTKVCPQELPVEKMVLAFEGVLSNFRQPDVWNSCNGCGACVTTCPSEIPILDGIRVNQAALREEQFAVNMQTAALARYERKRKREQSEATAKALKRASRIQKSHTWT